MKLVFMVILMCKIKVLFWGSNMIDFFRMMVLGGYGVIYLVVFDSVCFFVFIL